mgnify:CR=1 FL=1
MRNSSSLADNWFEMLKENALNLLCVAAHYSNANTCADAFLDKREELRNYALFMKNNTSQQMVDKFCNECVTVDVSLARRYPSSGEADPSTDIGFAVGLTGFSADRVGGAARGCDR